MGKTDRLGCGVYADGRVEIGGPALKVAPGCGSEGNTFIATDIAAWRKTNEKIEELAKLAGV